MTDQKPCLPECREYCNQITEGQPCGHPMGTHRHDHAPACPNAKPVEPAIWDNTTICFGNDCPNCEREKAKPAEPTKVLTRNQAFLRDLSKPAEPQESECTCGHSKRSHRKTNPDWCGCLAYEPKPAEPPKQTVLSTERYLAKVKDERDAMERDRDALAAEIERLRGALTRLGSMKAFDVGTCHVSDEIIKRVDYARAALKEASK